MSLSLESICPRSGIAVHAAAIILLGVIGFAYNWGRWPGGSLILGGTLLAAAVAAQLLKAHRLALFLAPGSGAHGGKC
jgi:hypothetical protein